MKVRLAFHLLCLSVCLLPLTSRAAAQTLGGARGQGAASILTAHGEVTAPVTVTVTAAAGGYCKIKLVLGGGALTAAATRLCTTS